VTLGDFSPTKGWRFPTGLRLLNLLFGSWTAVVFLFLYVPIILLVVFSFNDSRFTILWKGFTWKWYGEIWKDTRLIEALNNSLIIAAATTVLAVALGTMGAWLMHRYRFPLMRLVSTLVFIPMVIPEIIMGISLLILFAALGADLGYITVIISHVTFCFPFVLVAVQARLQGIDPFLEEAAMDLGATPMQAFWKVIVPYLMPAIVSGALMSFTLSMDELIVTFFTAGPESRTLPLEVFGRVKKGLSPSLNAISTLFILSTILLVIATESMKKIRK